MEVLVVLLEGGQGIHQQVSLKNKRVCRRARDFRGRRRNLRQLRVATSPVLRSDRRGDRSQHDGTGVFLQGGSTKHEDCERFAFPLDHGCWRYNG